MKTLDLNTLKTISGGCAPACAPAPSCAPAPAPSCAPKPSCSKSCS